MPDDFGDDEGQEFLGEFRIQLCLFGKPFQTFDLTRLAGGVGWGQVMLGLLGWDQYLKNVIVVDADVDITKDSEVLWALATHFQPHKDVVIIEGLPGNALDPSASGIGTTSRMGLDATRGPNFHGVRARISDEASARAAALLKSAG